MAIPFLIKKLPTKGINKYVYLFKKVGFRTAEMSRLKTVKPINNKSKRLYFYYVQLKYLSHLVEFN